MKVMIIGSCPTNSTYFDDFKNYCYQIAETLLKLNSTILICSLFKDSADYWVYQQFSQKSSNIELHYWDNGNTRKEISNIATNKQIKLFPYLDDKTELKISYAYLFCQLNALKFADVIIAIGGKESGSANLLLSIANDSKTIIPIIKFNGAARAYYDKYRYKLSDIISGNLGLIASGTPGEIISAFLHTEKSSIYVKKKKKVFISYARDNATWADMTEVFLRRRGVTLFRDESDFKPGTTIQNTIMDELKDSNIFIALWCKEYACSPWCYDEIEEALNLSGKMEIWILCVDDTRIVPKKARTLIYYRIHNRQELEGKLLDLIGE